MNKLFLDSKANLERLFEEEKIIMSESVTNKLLALISVLTVYEEEEIKIFPKLVIGNGIYKTLSMFLTNSHIIRISEENCEAGSFEKKIKALIPFCNTGWHVFIDVCNEDDTIYYGIVRTYTGISGFDLQKQIFEGITEPLKLLFIETLDKSSLIIQGVAANLLVDFKLYDDPSIKADNINIEQMCEDITNDISIQKKQENVNKVFSKFFKMAQKKIHGTILLVVDVNNRIENIPDAISDGNWLNEKDYLDISESAIKVLSEHTNPSDIEKHYSLTGLFMAMMNIDGITIINTKGQIIAYNVFLKHSSAQGISGGARRRTALSLKSLNSDLFKIKGVYFQSQDGNAHYERVDDVE